MSASESARVSATRPECADLGTDTSARVMQELVYMGADISKAKADVEKADFVIIQDDKTVRCDAVVSYIAHLIRNTRACRLTLILGASPWTSHGCSSNQLQLVCAHVCVGCACLRATRVPGSCMRLDWARVRVRVPTLMREHWPTVGSCVSYACAGSAQSITPRTARKKKTLADKLADSFNT